MDEAAACLPFELLQDTVEVRSGRLGVFVLHRELATVHQDVRDHVTAIALIHSLVETSFLLRE